MKTIFKGILYKTIFFPKLGGRLKGGVVLKEGFYGKFHLNVFQTNVCFSGHGAGGIKRYLWVVRAQEEGAMGLSHGFYNVFSMGGIKE